MMKRLICMIFWRTVKKEYRGPMLDDSYKTVMVGQKNKVASQSSTINSFQGMEPGQAPNFNSPKSKLHCAASIRSLKASGTVSESPALPLHDALPALNGACG